MGWLTTADIEARVQRSLLVTLADDNGDSVADTDVLVAVRSDAEAEVESRLAGRYATPFLVADPVLVEIAAAIVIDRLHLRKSIDPPPHVKETLAQALESLDRIARGEAHLTTISPRRTLAQSSREAEERTFTDERLGRL